MNCFWQGADNDAPSASATEYNFITASALAAWSATESTRTLPVSEAITITKLTVYFDTAPGSGNAYSFTIRDDGADTAASVTLADGATSATWTGGVAVAALSMIDMSATPAGTPAAIGTQYWTVEYETAGDHYLLPAGTGTQASNAAASYMWPIGGASQLLASDPTAYGIVAPTDVTVTKLVAAFDVAPGSGTSYDVSFSHNGPNDYLITTIANGTTIASATDVIPVAPGDLMGIRLAPSASPAAVRLKTCLTIVPSEPGEIMSGFSAPQSPSDSMTTYQQPIGTGGLTWDATESLRQLRVSECTLKKFYVVTTSPGSGRSRTQHLRVNGANTGLSVVIADTAFAGNDASTTYELADGDLVSVSSVPSGTPNATSGMKFSYVMQRSQALPASSSTAFLPFFH